MDASWASAESVGDICDAVPGSGAAVVSPLEIVAGKGQSLADLHISGYCLVGSKASDFVVAS